LFVGATCFARDPATPPRTFAGAQDETASQAPPSKQWARSTEPFYDDFSQGLLPENWVRGGVSVRRGGKRSSRGRAVACGCPADWRDGAGLLAGFVPSLQVVPYGSKGCCSSFIEDNLAVSKGVVNGTVKNVLQLMSLSEDSGGCAATDHAAPPPGNRTNTNSSDACYKFVSSAGALASTRFFASGLYEVSVRVVCCGLTRHGRSRCCAPHRVGRPHPLEVVWVWWVRRWLPKSPAPPA
jgi:hypothetical protein